MKLILEMYSNAALSGSKEIDINGDETLGWLLYKARIEFNTFSCRLHMTTVTPGRSNLITAHNVTTELATVGHLTQPISDVFSDNATVIFRVNLRGGPSTPDNLVGEGKAYLDRDEYNRVEQLKLGALTNVGSLSAGLGIFSSPQPPAVAPTNMSQTLADIPKSYCCPITLKIMVDPVLLILDGYTYERADITEWLSQHRTSPITRQLMKPDETIQNVLVANRAIKDAIDEFKLTNPELFDSMATTSNNSAIKK